MLRIVMDSAGDLPSEWLELYDVSVIPVNLHFGETTFLQGVDLTDEDFYRLVQEKQIVPKTSQPSPHQFIEHYWQNAEPGDTVLSIHVTGKLSGTLASAQMAAAELKGQLHIIPFDSASGSAAMGYMVKEAREMDRKGEPIERILSRLEFIRQNITIILTLDTLDFARMSGRVKALQAAIASLLDVKPIVVLQEGILDMGDRVRTRGKAITKVIEMVHEKMGSRLVNAAAVHAQDPETGKELLARINSVLNCHQLILTTLSVGVAANLGPGTVGVVAYPVKEV